jgi:hypothetical protein
MRRGIVKMPCRAEAPGDRWCEYGGWGLLEIGNYAPALNAATMMAILCQVRNHQGWEGTLIMALRAKMGVEERTRYIVD